MGVHLPLCLAAHLHLPKPSRGVCCQAVGLPVHGVVLLLVPARAAAQRLIGVVLTLCEDTPAQQEGQQHAHQQHQRFVDGVVQLLLTCPGLVPLLPAAIKVRHKGAGASQPASQPVCRAALTAAAHVLRHPACQQLPRLCVHIPSLCRRACCSHR